MLHAVDLQLEGQRWLQVAVDSVFFELRTVVVEGRVRPGWKANTAIYQCVCVCTMYMCYLF